MPWAHGPANIIAFPNDFASQFPPGTPGTWILETSLGIDFASRFPPMTRLVRMAPVYGISHGFRFTIPAGCRWSVRCVHVCHCVYILYMSLFAMDEYWLGVVWLFCTPASGQHF